MTRSLVFKLTLAFWLVSLIGVTLVALFAVRATNNEFSTLQNDRIRKSLVDQSASYYAATGSWEGAGVTLQRLVQDTNTPFAIVDPQRRVIIPGLGLSPNRRVPMHTFENGTPIEVDGETVGVLLVPLPGSGQPYERPGRGRFNPEAAFLDRINNAVVWAAGGATAVSLVIGFFLARTLTKPIKALTQATRAVAGGNLEQKVDILSNDELGELAASFNQMSSDLAQSRDQRRQMTADIAHDLRTPLSLILGHAEALSDGVLPATPEALHIIHDEAQRLNRLIEDLRTLSLAETGELRMMMRVVSPEALIDRTAVAYTPAAQQKQITVITDAQNVSEVIADPDRINQVLDNLMHNAIRHTPDGGQIELAAQTCAEGVQLSVKDSGPGIAAEDVPHIFSRFYRADKSRRRQEGGSGLGLAIAKSIVERHNGRIWAESVPGEGTTFHFTLPMAPPGNETYAAPL